jgi:Flp pilus assembly protein TadG
MKTRGSKDRRADLPVQRPKRGVRFRGEEGNALIEIAMVLPVFLAFVTGIGSFAIALSNQITLIQATGAGGQYLQEIRTSSTNPCADTMTAITNASPSLAAANIGLTLTMNGTVVNAKTCAGDQSDLVQGSAVTVATTYPCTLSVYGIHFASSCQLTAQVTEYEY